VESERDSFKEVKWDKATVARYGAFWETIFRWKPKGGAEKKWMKMKKPD